MISKMECGGFTTPSALQNTNRTVVAAPPPPAFLYLTDSYNLFSWSHRQMPPALIVSRERRQHFINQFSSALADSRQEYNFSI